MNNYAGSKLIEIGISTCKLCGGNMVVGDYIEQTFTGIPDFPGDKYPSTVSAGGSGSFRKNGCLKCSDCGHSIAF